MQRSVSFHPAAQQDADDPAAWYAERSVRAAVRFLDELERVVGLIANSPNRFQVSMLTSADRFFIDFRATSFFGPTT